MKVEQLYTSCLSEAAYFIESNGEAAVIDPLRDYQIYIDMANKRGVKIKYVFETHFHADFVSGHLDLSEKTGAPIIYGPNAQTDFKATIATDGQKFKIGNVEIETMHTPGHTPESTCYLLRDESGKPYCLFTGDTLFVGDVGRPDLFGTKITKEELAAMMYESLNQKIKPLANDIIVYPAHGPGSSCGKNLGKETWSTIGDQKKLNYALQEMSKADFVKSITDGLSSPPQYFPLNAAINKRGYESLDKILSKNIKPLSADEVESEIQTGTVVLDTRHQDEFEKGFIPSSVFVGLNGRFAEWVGTILDINTPLIIVADEGKAEESILRLARVGYENVKGYLSGGFESWKQANKKIDLVISIDTSEMELDIKFDNPLVMDVRKESEFNNGHVLNAENIVLQNFEIDFTKSSAKVEKPIYVHCQSGYRSMIAASLLKRKGYNNLRNISGGWVEISKTNIPIEKPKPVLS